MLGYISILGQSCGECGWCELGKQLGKSWLWTKRKRCRKSHERWWRAKEKGNHKHMEHRKIVLLFNGKNHGKSMGILWKIYGKQIFTWAGHEESPAVPCPGALGRWGEPVPGWGRNDRIYPRSALEKRGKNPGENHGKCKETMASEGFKLSEISKWIDIRYSRYSKYLNVIMTRPSNPSKSMSFYTWNLRFDPRWEADMKNNSGLTAEDPKWDDGDVLSQATCGLRHWVGDEPPWKVECEPLGKNILHRFYTNSIQIL